MSRTAKAVKFADLPLGHVFLLVGSWEPPWRKSGAGRAILNLTLDPRDFAVDPERLVYDLGRSLAGMDGAQPPGW
jgi:hypothetical protein